MVRFSDLPPELIFRVLCFLDLPELCVLQRTHSTFRQSIQDSQWLQYRFAATRAGVQNNMHTAHSASERLALLNHREKGWLHMNIDFQKSIPNVKCPSGIYDLTGRIYFRGDQGRKSIHYCQLPSRSSDTVFWKTVNVNKPLVDIGVSVYEHDLIAILTYSPHPTREGQNIIEIALLELSTGKPHPQAKNPVLFIDETYAPKPAILLEIVGEYLVLVMTHRPLEFDAMDTLRVYEWKTGTLKMSIQRSHRTYHDFIFLSPTIILLPNIKSNTLDVWEIPTGSKPPPAEPFLCLVLPALSAGSRVLSFNCRCEPNPTPNGTPHSQALFHPSSEDAIVVLNVAVTWGAYSLFVHRSALLRVCTIHRSENEDSVVHDTPSTLTVDHIPDKRIKDWDCWGPSITRVFDASLTTMSWITTTVGQRAIVTEASDEDEDGDEDEEGQHSQLVDFNPLTVKRVIQDRNNGSGIFDSHVLVLGTTLTPLPGIQLPVESQLPYVAVDIPFKNSWVNRYRGFLLYEEGILVLLGDKHSDHDKIEILHVGGG